MRMAALRIVGVSGLMAAACTATGAAPGASEFVRGMRWQITLVEPPTALDLEVDAWDLDLVDTPRATIAACTFEPGRPDAADFAADVIGDGYEDEAFAEERYLDVTNPVVFDIMKTRLDLALAKGCDAVDPDNVDLPTHDTGFNISAADMRTFNRGLIAEA